jgi:signal transduction histidine kinase
VGTSLIARDLTEKKKMIEILVQSEKLAEIGRMGSGIVHEIKNPLTSIMMMSSILTSDKELPPKAIKYADIIEKESQRILRLSRNILSFARPQKAEMKAVDLNGIVEETLELVEYELKKAKVHVNRELEGGMPPVRGDQEKLKQVFLNIITNACHAMQEGGELFVRTVPPAGLAPLRERAPQGWHRCEEGETGPGALGAVQIEDRGPGMPPDVLEKIFEPFFSTKAEGKGTGLGLYISRNIIMEHRGRMAVRSRVGEGTVFTIFLPLDR